MTVRLCLLQIIVLFISACGGGGGNSLKGGCDGSCTDAGSFLSAVDVENIVARAAVEAGAHSAAATIAVVDRVGNVLAVYQMTGAAASVRFNLPIHVWSRFLIH